MCYKSFIIFSLFFIYKLAYANTVDIQISEVNTNLRFILSSENKLDSSIFLLKDPSRLVIDFKDIDRFVKQKIKSNYIKDIRASKNKDSSRLVFDIDFNPKNIAVTRVFSFNKDKNNIVIDLNTNNISNINNYIIIVDPGHGGKDPGAIKGNTKEKKLTLLAAKILQKELKKKGFDVFLTREKDQYISLRNRVKFARKYAGDLFISIHADSTRNISTRGISIYSLSDKASDKLAKELAAKQNKSDLIGGLDLDDIDEEVSNILIDLSRRETKNSSIEFAELFVLVLNENRLKLLRSPHRQAGFAVLKAPDIPSVLIEMGFISNNSDLKKLLDKNYLKNLMSQVSLVVFKYFNN